MKTIALTLPDTLAAELDAYCERTGTIRMKFIRQAIANALETAGGSPIIDGKWLPGTKTPLPAIDLAHRETIKLQSVMYGTFLSAYNATLATWLPSEWHDYFVDLAATKNMTVSGVVMERIKRHMDGDDILRYAEEKGWPTAYARRHLINHVFPELPYCEFDPPPARRVFARRNRGG